MNAFLVVLLFILMLAFLYVLLSARLTHLLDARFRDHYRAQLMRDMQEFYREMESYAALLENRVNRFKKIMERNEELTLRFGEVADSLKKTRNAKQLSEIADFIERSVDKENKILEALSTISKRGIIDEVPAQSSMNPEAKPSEINQSPESKPAREKKTKPAAKRGRKTTTSKGSLPVTEERITNPRDDEAADLAAALAEEMERPRPQKTPEPPRQMAAQPTKPQPSSPPLVARVLSSIGRNLIPVFTGRQNEKTSQPEAAPAKAPEPQSPAQFLSELNQRLEKPLPSQEEVRARKEREEDMETLFDAMALESEPRPKAARERQVQKPAEVHSPAAKMDTGELAVLMQALQEASQRPRALRRLLEENFTLKELSDFSGVPLSDLELTRRLYQL